MQNKSGLIAGLCAVGLLVMAAYMVRSPRQEASAYAWEYPNDWFFHDDDSQRTKHDAMLGKPMPALQLTDWQNGEVTSADLKGKVVVLDFWATWCGPCIAAFPHNNALYNRYKDRGLIFLGVCTANGQENFAAITKSQRLLYPNARDANLTAQQAWNVMWYPTYAVIDRRGNVRAVGLQPDFVEEVVVKLLAEPTP